MKLLLKLLFVVAILTSVAIISCTPDNKDEDTELATEPQATDPGDSENSGTPPPPPPPDNGEN